jgi:VanZ family protein
MFTRYTWPAIVWSLVILIATLIPGKAIPKVGFFQIDKVVHFFIFGILMFLSCYALKKTHDYTGKPVRFIRIALLYSLALGIVIELIQQYVPGRGPSVADVVANSIGVALGYGAFRLLQKRSVV